MNRPEVLIDGMAFENDTQSGIWRLFFEVMSRTHNDINYTLLLSQKPVQSIPSGVAVRRLGPRYNPQSRKQLHLRLLNWPNERMIAAKHPDAIWHSTFFSPAPKGRKQVVVTVFDMIAEKLYAIGPFLEQREQKAKALQSADRVLAISNETAKDLLLFYPQLADRTHVMHLGGEHLNRQTTTDSEDRRSERCDQVANSNYCLFVGGRYSYKNFSCVVEALALSSWPSNLKLVVVGPLFDKAERSLIHALGVAQKIVSVGRVSNDLLESYYRNAKCFVFPSLMEGFGIPILEAQSLCTVVVASDIPIFREVAGNTAIFFQPHSPSDLAHAIEKSMNDQIRSPLIAAASQNVNRFSWDETARITLECYEQLWSKRF